MQKIILTKIVKINSHLEFLQFSFYIVVLQSKPEHLVQFIVFFMCSKSEQ